MSEEEKSTTTTTTSALQDNIERKGKNAYYFAHAHKANGPKWDGNVQPRLLSRHSSTTTTPGIEGADNDAMTNNEGTVSTTTQMETQLANTTITTTKTSFEYSKSNITKYAFVDEGPKLKIYIDFQDIKNCCTANDVQLDWDESSFCLRVDNYVDPSLRVVEGGTEEKQDEKMDDTEDTTTTTTPSEVTKKPETYCLSFGKLHGPISKATYKLKPNKIIVILTKKLKKVEKEENDETAETAKKTEEDEMVEADAANTDKAVEEDVVFSDSDDDDDEIETWPAIGAKGADF